MSIAIYWKPQSDISLGNVIAIMISLSDRTGFLMRTYSDPESN